MSAVTICFTSFRINKALKHCLTLHDTARGFTSFRINKALKPAFSENRGYNCFTSFRINKALKHLKLSLG